MEDIMSSEEYMPISYFGKENTRRIKRSHECKPKKIPAKPVNKESATIEGEHPVWRSTRYSQQRGKYVAKKERKDPFEPVVYYPPKKTSNGNKLLSIALKDLHDS